MKITFKINYFTRWGEELWLTVPEDGKLKAIPAEGLRLTPLTDGFWQTEVDLPRCNSGFSYSYQLRDESGKVLRNEWRNHHFPASKGVESVIISDDWHDLPADKPLFSSAITKSIMSRRNLDTNPPLAPRQLRIRVAAPLIEPGQHLVITGESPYLGSWNPERGVKLLDSDFPYWEAVLSTEALGGDFEFKFVAVDSKTLKPVEWETGENRIFHLPRMKAKEAMISTGYRFRRSLPEWKCAGTAIPVFSIRTEEDFGAGDFVSLKKMIDWCARTGQRVLQILPVNDTTMTRTWTDSYPYNANSTFALHPLYLRPEAVGLLKDPSRRAYFEQLRRELNALPAVDYERVTRAKEEYMREIFAETGEATAKTDSYRNFVSDNEFWLKPYTAFSLMRDKMHSPDPRRWKGYAEYSSEKADKICKAEPKEAAYVYFVQYHLDKQLRQARDYAHANRVVLKGDIPIGISRDSVEAWQYPDLFNLNAQAGAPPDAFAEQGQNWGFPTYNWDTMARDGFQWWKSRFRNMAKYFDAYRIDHILGFFRIWQIPYDQLHGLLGIFNPALPFSPEEMQRLFGFDIDIDLHTNPFIMHWMLPEWFGDAAQEVTERFLTEIVDGRYRLKPFVATQRRIKEYFDAEPDNDHNRFIRDGLMGLVDDVLFIEDPYQKGKYHPRIAAQFTYQYRYLSDQRKQAFNRIYDDFFYHRNDHFWREKAMQKLPALTDATDMMACGEDLGMIPDCVPSVMKELEILSLEIQRMPKDPSEEFGNVFLYPYFSVCTTSTHDMPGIRAWWEEDPELSQRFYNQVLHHDGKAPFFAEPWICTEIVNLNLASPSMLCVLPLQDWLATDAAIRFEMPQQEQINIPAIPRHYWRWRMHLTVEDLLKEDAFNQSVHSMVKESGR